MSASPRTDDVWQTPDAIMTEREKERRDLSRQLERELADCKDKHAKSILAWGKEVATALESKAAAERELAEAREQRDRLADAALYLADLAEKNTNDGDLWKSAIENVRTLAAGKGDPT